MDKVRLVMKTDFQTKFYQLGFWVLLSLIAGGIIGYWHSGVLIEKKLKDSVTYKAIKIDGREYDLKERF